MTVYRVHIDREVTTWDRFTRYIEAESAVAAEAKGLELADAADRDCPDDAGLSGCDTELGAWSVNSVEPADAQELIGADIIGGADEEEA